MRQLKLFTVIASSFIFFSCGGKGGGSDTPESIAKKWCELNAKVHKAPDGGDEYGKAKQKLEQYEQDMEAKYGKDEAFMNKIEDAVEKCEDASEGR